MTDTPETNRDPADESSISIGGWFVRNSMTLAILAIAVGFALWKQWDFLLIGKVMAGLGFVIFIHELGHFLAAKWCDVHVEAFSIGFGPALPGCSFWRGETRYMVALFPLGGYVKMVGEGAEGEEGDEDPRSFKNKTVGQRMLIISAGVIMNVFLAATCYVGVFMTSGAERMAGVVGTVDAGSPAWQEGIPAGVTLTKVGSIEHPFFDLDIRPEVMHWSAGVPMPVTYELNGQTINTTVTPKKYDGPGRQMIGIGLPFSTKLIVARGLRLKPFTGNTAAARATPALANGDQIIGTTDPENPEKTIELGDSNDGRSNHYHFMKRMQQLADREITLLVRRAGADAAATPETVKIPPAYHTNLGLVMQMGPITAVRRGSPADVAGIRTKDADREVGDILEAVELAGADGTTIRYSTAPNGDERLLDPARLPDELRRWAAGQSVKPKTLKLSLIRQVEHKERKEVSVAVTWDDQWRFDRSFPSGEGSPQAIDELGLAYQILTVVKSVVPGSPAAQAGIQPDDVVKEVGLYDPEQPDAVKPQVWSEVEIMHWANMHAFLQSRGDVKKLGLKVMRAGAPQELHLACVPDTTWPMADRGFRFDFERRLQKAEGFVDAFKMGTHDTINQIGVIYNSLFAMMTGKISFKKNASGPIMIAAAAYEFAGHDLPTFVLFLAMISINLAVINFLPIPVLDGGHMAFLIYEKLRGKPAPEHLRVAATFLGIALIFSLMLFVTYLDIRRFF